jgi:hypothetical protein
LLGKKLVGKRDEGESYMAFERFSGLGREKFQKIVNELTRGIPAQTVARLVHQWGDAQDVREETLAKQLKRLHTAITNGAFGGDLAQQAKEKAIVRIMWLHGSTLNCLDALIEVAIVQRTRVLTLYEHEQASGKHIAGLNAVINDYRDLLVAIQKVKFDLGLDEFKRGIPVRASETSVTSPDGVTVRRQVLEAYSTLEEVITRRCSVPVSEVDASRIGIQLQN